MRRVAVRVPLARAEAARAQWLERFPLGFEERALGDEVELAAYVEEVPVELGVLTVEDVAAGWEDRWRDFHRPVAVGALWVGPPWASPPPELIPVVIDPGQAFGTGGHATTRLCLELLQELPPGSLLDVGCGSGVLAIAAAKLGHAPVTALDVDPAAVDATLRNAAENEVTVAARVADAAIARPPAARAAVANIALAAVEAIVPRLEVGVAITSGYLRRDQPDLAGFRHTERRTLDDWAADSWQRE